MIFSFFSISVMGLLLENLGQRDAKQRFAYYKTFLKGDDFMSGFIHVLMTQKGFGRIHGIVTLGSIVFLLPRNFFCMNHQ